MTVFFQLKSVIIHVGLQTLKRHCHAIWQLYKKLEGVFASIEIQN